MTQSYLIIKKSKEKRQKCVPIKIYWTKFKRVGELIDCTRIFVGTTLELDFNKAEKYFCKYFFNK